jgi:hypothetical protein
VKQHSLVSRLISYFPYTSLLFTFARNQGVRLPSFDSGACRGQGRIVMTIVSNEHNHRCVALTASVVESCCAKMKKRLQARKDDAPDVEIGERERPELAGQMECRALV